MITQIGDSSRGLLESLEKATADAEHLDGQVTRVADLLKARGILFSNEFAATLNTLREDLRVSVNGAQQATQKLKQLEELVETSSLLTSSLELDRVLEQVLDRVIHLTRAERVYLMLKDPKTGELTIRAARNWDKENVDKDEASFSWGIIKSTFESGTPALTTNAQFDNRFQDMASVVSNTIRSIVCVPFAVRGQLIGALYADNRIMAGIFGNEIVPTLTAFANQAAMAIDNARLFAQVKADLDEAQQQLQTLRIQIDLEQSKSQIDEIVDSELFKRLARRDNPPKAE